MQNQSGVQRVRFYAKPAEYSRDEEKYHVFFSSDPPREGKFILVELCQGEFILRCLPRGSHLSIVQTLESETGEDMNGKIRGGGQIEARAKGLQIDIGGKSLDYGPADHNLAQKLIQEALPECTVNIVPWW